MKKTTNPIILSRLVSSLANERTLLAYLRTFLAFLAAGVSFQEFFHRPSIQHLGSVLIMISVGVIVLGILSFIKARRKVDNQTESVDAQFLD